MQRNIFAKRRACARRAGCKILLALWCGVSLLALSGCRGKQPAVQPGADAYGLTGKVQTYPLKGIVVSTNPAAGEVSIDSERIPGFMDPMIMPYKLSPPNIAGELHPGDHITAVLHVSDTGQSVLDQVVITAQAKPDYVPSVIYNVPKPGQAVPNFQFLNQSNKVIHIDQFRGKVLLVTFIYTRCPLPDYCVRMSRNFAQIDHTLAKDPALYAKTHLLSVSFDPSYDTPKVLRSYGGAYTGKYSKETFSHWDFAAPPKAELETVAKFFDVGITPGKAQTLTHSLSTVVIAPDGKIVSWYPSNTWKPSSLIQDVKRTLKQAKG